MSVPVSITYDASGIKVQSISTSVGAGWNLNAGGMVVRQVNGYPDDIKSGDGVDRDINDSDVISFNSYMNSLRHPTHNYYLNFEAYEHDIQDITKFLTMKSYHDINEADLMPDTYSFNAPGLSGSMMIDPATGNAISIDDPDVTATYSAASNGSINSWVITNRDGTIYHFLLAEETFQSFSNSVNEGDRTYNSSWYLTKIESPNKKDTFDFIYTNQGYWDSEQFYHNGETRQNRLFDCSNLSYDPTQNTFTTTSNLFDYKIKQSTLSKIRLNGTEIVAFSHTTNRLDLSGRKELDQIDIKYGTKMIKTYTLNQSYFTNGSTPTDEQDYRLKLDGVTINGYDDQGNAVLTPTDQVLTYTFEYFGNDDELPSRDSFAIDYLGYYNGITNNTTLVPKYTDPYGNVFTGANREPNFNYKIKGLLQEVFYPTGGSTEFEFDYLANISTTF